MSHIQQSNDGMSQDQQSSTTHNDKTAQSGPKQKPQKRYTYTSPDTGQGLKDGAIPPKKPTRESKLGPVKSKQGHKPPKATREGKLGPVKAKNRVITTAHQKTPVQENTDLTSATQDNKVTISKGFMMLASEGDFGEGANTVKRPHWPGYGSGVTIGFGFDIGAAFPQKGAASEKMARDAMVQAGIDSATASKLAQYVGIQGVAAQAPAQKLRKEGIQITNAQALALLDLTYNKMNHYVHHYIKFDSNLVHPALEQVFTYFAYARFDFKWGKKMAQAVAGKAKTTQAQIGAGVLAQLRAEELRKPKQKERAKQLKQKGWTSAAIKKQIAQEIREHKLYSKLADHQLQMTQVFLKGISGYEAEGLEVEFSPKVMEVSDLAASETFDLMDEMGEDVKLLKQKGTRARAQLKGQPYAPTPQINPVIIKNVPKVSQTPPPRAYQGFSVGKPGSIYLEALMNYTNDLQPIQQKLKEVGLLSEADFAKEYPTTSVKPPPPAPPTRPKHAQVDPIPAKHTLETPNSNPHILQNQQQAQVQQHRAALLEWLQGLSEEEVREVAENPNLNTPFAQLVMQSGMGHIPTKAEMIKQLMTWRGQQVAPLARQDTPSIKTTHPDQLPPPMYHLNELEQQAMAIYGKVPVGIWVLAEKLPQTITAIEVFQREVKGGTVDGRIDPGGATLGQLMGSSKASVAAARKAYVERKKQEEENKKKEELEQELYELLSELGEELREKYEALIHTIEASTLVKVLKSLLGANYKNKSSGKKPSPKVRTNKNTKETMERVDFTKYGVNNYASNRWLGKGAGKYTKKFDSKLPSQLKYYFGKDITKKEVLDKIKSLEQRGDHAKANNLKAKLHHAMQYAVVETLEVDKNPLYQKRYVGTRLDTYCNIYTYDVVTAMGGYIPRVWWYNASLKQILNGKKVIPDYGKTVREMNANDMTVWMGNYGINHFGWRKASDMKQAQKEANNGKLVVILADIIGTGHVAVVMPERGQLKANPKGGRNGKTYKPLTSQAGAVNFKYSSSTEGDFWNLKLGKGGSGAWIFDGRPSSPIATPEELGWNNKQ